MKVIAIGLGVTSIPSLLLFCWWSFLVTAGYLQDTGAGRADPFRQWAEAWFPIVGGCIGWVSTFLLIREMLSERKQPGPWLITGILVGVASSFWFWGYDQWSVSLFSIFMFVVPILFAVTLIALHIASSWPEKLAR